MTRLREIVMGPTQVRPTTWRARSPVERVEAEILHAQFCRALDDETAVLVVPESSRLECRKNSLSGRAR